MSSRTFGIDLGTNNIKIYREKNGVIVNARNMIAIDDMGAIIAIGEEAYEMYEKAPENIQVTYPMNSGVIADFSNMQELLQLFISQYGGKAISGNKEFYVAVPTDITDVEKRAFQNLIESSKMRRKRVLIVEKPIADAVGIGLDIQNPSGVLLVDIGGDTTEISVMSLGGIVISKLVHVGGNKLDEDIMLAIKKEKNVIIGMKTAEECKNKLASAVPGENDAISVMGRDLLTGLPAAVTVTSEMVYQSIKEDLFTIIEAVKIILERTPPEISSDIIDSGIHVTGGCSQIKNLAQLIEAETELPSKFFDKPQESAILGLGRIIEEDDLKELAFPMSQPMYE